MVFLAEYMWLDGAEPTQQLRSKTRIVPNAQPDEMSLSSFPQWSFDGSSTFQAASGDSDLMLEPVTFTADPLRPGGYLVLCEVFTAAGAAHRSNTRSRLRRVLDRGADAAEPWVGFEQEYTLFQHGVPLGFPTTGYPAPQGSYYCGVGADRSFGRELVEGHTAACLQAGLMTYGVNAEVMPGQWEFQIGYRGVEAESADPLTVSDQLWLARWLLLRIGERHGVTVSFDPKPVEGDWNGAGAHTNFSTRAMRSPRTGRWHIDEAVRRLAQNHEVDIAHYGAGLEARLTGLHETCAIDQFRDGVADRGASIRIPRRVARDGCGYLEDRRPGANCDPYRVCTQLLKSICGRRPSSAGTPRLAVAV